MGGRLAIQCFFELIVGTRCVVLFPCCLDAFLPTDALFFSVREAWSHSGLQQRIGPWNSAHTISKTYASKLSLVAQVGMSQVSDGLLIIIITRSTKLDHSRRH